MNGSADQPKRIEARRAVRKPIVREAARARDEADHAAMAGGIADRAAAVGSDVHEAQSKSGGDSGSGGGPAGGAPDIPRVQSHGLKLVHDAIHDEFGQRRGAQDEASR